MTVTTPRPRTRTRLVVLGGAGHARDVVSIAQACDQFEILGVVGPAGPDLALLPVPSLGDDDWLANAAADIGYVIGIGAGRVRARLDQRAGLTGRTARQIVHPGAWIDPRCVIHDGCVVWPGSILAVNVRAGRHVHIGANAAVGHDAVLEDYATLLPGSVISGSVRVGRGATVGAGATVIEGISIGEGAMVGAGAVVIRDVAAKTTVVGVPARELRTVVEVS